ncbi:MAG TPA: hypothetical protein VFS23_02700 [Vicinamibacterales bacterium]|nr:hypothetical protein [Vicinamibacterales bacterium]
MPDKKEVLLITITKNGNNPKRCKANKHFVARKGSKVTFVFNEPGALITFLDGSPFDEPAFRPGTKVVSKATIREYEYFVSWPNGGAGVGNGTGEVIGR